MYLVEIDMYLVEMVIYCIFLIFVLIVNIDLKLVVFFNFLWYMK